MDQTDACNVNRWRTLNRVRPFEVYAMEILLNLLIAAEAAYEMNPTPKMERWIEILEEKIYKKIAREREK